MASSRRQSPVSATNEPVSTVLPKMTDPPQPAGNDSASSEPPEKPALNGSKPAPTKDTGSGTASPYGTRSRNRTGTSRPNYAEDKDLDVEMFDARDDGSKKAIRQAASASASEGAAAAPRPSNGLSSRKPLPTESTPHVVPKEHTSTTNSTPAAVSTPAPSSQPSRKRKAATSQVSAPVAGHVQQTSSNGPTTTVQKRPAVVSHNGTGYSETNILTFENCSARPKDGKMVADDGTVLEVNGKCILMSFDGSHFFLGLCVCRFLGGGSQDTLFSDLGTLSNWDADHVYLVCEPPGEPYYLGRIMEFLHQRNDANLPVDALRVNWYYRPKDIGRKVQDTRLVFATMHSDISPLTSLRGKCQIKHKAEISTLAEYKRQPDCFWYEKLYDRYIMKNYDVIPTKQIVNVPEKVKKVLDERWKFILVEQGRGKELTSAVKLCKRCSGYCAR